MKPVKIVLIACYVLVAHAFAGKPIVMSLQQACKEADLIVIATVGPTRPVPEEFEGFSKWHEYGFSKLANVRVYQTFHGNCPETIHLYGGKIMAGTDYRIESGRYLLMLKKVDGDAYTAVDYHFSFMRAFLRFDGHTVEWLNDYMPREVEVISDKAVKARIASIRTESKQPGVDQPATQPADNVPVKVRPPTPTPKDGPR